MAFAPKPGVLEIAPYVGGRASVPGVVAPIKLSSNEGALGPSPKALAAYTAATCDVSIYPEGSAQILREAVGAAYGLDPARIVCGNGSDELLTLIANAYLRPGDEVLFGEHSFLVYKIAALANSGVPVSVKEKDRRVDVDAMLAAVTPKTKLVYLANPANPTGTYLPFDEVKRLHAGLSPDTLLVLDAAYAEFVRRNDYDAGIALCLKHDNVVMTRTFSKVYGLAGLRVGWALVSPAVADVLNRIRMPFNVSIPAQRAGAAAMSDHDHLQAALDHNTLWRDRLTAAIRGLGLAVDDSVTNFLLIRFPGTPGKTAAEADRYLCEHGLILRGMAAYGLPESLRLTIGPADACEKFLQVLTAFMARP
ncbi:histidinol-phosphate transaminase [Rhizomicrobium electricum]|uniref:Histidinol-phosphate aminotransferase n=1 Tax=Rhizomicrobium electricum TaxID=480070 RepID=A0ABN1F468_9PROT|nr:histidinol-phosphate transaminase [Rhizomicrobium electricum]NIJ49377.1 histidinol-phosphate aminotransferase [Rhizomicrobium electricum]